MNLFIDADACPVIDLAIKISRKYKVNVTLIADTSHCIEKKGVKTITVEKGNDSADFKIVNLVKENDVVITQDYGLAAMVLAKKAYCLNQNGLIFSDENINSLLLSRHISKKIRNAGGRTKGPSKRTSENDDSFSSSLLQIFISLKNVSDNLA